MSERLTREIVHGKHIASLGEQIWGWTGPSGSLRFGRRVAFLTADHSSSRPGEQSCVLELGCGTGLFTAAIAKSFASVVAVDISDDLLTLARLRLNTTSVQVVNADAHHLPFATGSFDRIVGCSVLHHLDWHASLREAHRVLKPGGVVRFSEPNLANPQIYLQKNWKWLKRRVHDSEDEYAFTGRQIQASLAGAGFVQIEVVPYEFLHPLTPQFLIPAVEALESALEKTPARAIAGSLKIFAIKPNTP